MRDAAVCNAAVRAQNNLVKRVGALVTVQEVRKSHDQFVVIWVARGAHGARVRAVKVNAEAGTRS